MNKFIRIALLLFMLCMFIWCVRCTLMYEWASGFRENPNAAMFASRARWFLAGTILSLLGIILTLWLWIRRR